MNIVVDLNYSGTVWTIKISLNLISLMMYQGDLRGLFLKEVK